MSASNSDRRIATNRRGAERRRVIASESASRPPVARESGASGERRLGDLLTLEPIQKLTVAVEALAARLSDNKSSSVGKPTCTVEEAAALLGTTAKGIYALHERGKLPK